MRNIDSEIRTWEEIFKKEKALYNSFLPKGDSIHIRAVWESSFNHMNIAQLNINRLYRQKSR